MENLQATRIANRLVQLFGRINRGRNDYGVFLIAGDKLSNWIGRERNLALLPELLQQQILIGREVQAGLRSDANSGAEVIEVIDQILRRDKGWLDYYQREVKLAKIDQTHLDRVNSAEPALIEATLSEAKYAAAMWSNDPMSARQELEDSVDKTSVYDVRLAGWHSVWIGATYDYEGDSESALREYANAMRRLNRSMILPRKAPNVGAIKDDSHEQSAFGSFLIEFFSYPPGQKFDSKLRKMTDNLLLIESESSNQAEAGVRQLGELLGLTATRPDDEFGAGPDVLWYDEAKKIMLGFELKTNKNDPATYHKREISQGHHQLEWMRQNYGVFINLGLIYVGHDGTVDSAATPSDNMVLCSVESLASLRDKVIAIVKDLRKVTPLERPSTIGSLTDKGQWDIETLFEELSVRKLVDLKHR